MDIGKVHHHTVVINVQGERLLSRRHGHRLAGPPPLGPGSAAALSALYGLAEADAANCTDLLCLGAPVSCCPGAPFPARGVVPARAAISSSTATGRCATAHGAAVCRRQPNELVRDSGPVVVGLFVAGLQALTVRSETRPAMAR